MACPSTWGLESHRHLGPQKAQEQSGSGKVGFEREDDDRSAIWSTFSILLTGMWVWKFGCPHIDRNSAFKTRSFPRCLKISTSGYVIFNHIKSHDQTLWDPNRDWSFFPFVFVRITLAFRHVKLLYRISNLSSKSSIPTGCWNEVLVMHQTPGTQTLVMEIYFNETPFVYPSIVASRCHFAWHIVWSTKHSTHVLG